MKYKCVVTDLDDTLLCSDKTLSQYTVSVIEKLSDNGVHFVIATGRAFHAIPQNVLSLKGLRYVITSNGVSIYDVHGRKAIYTSCLPKGFAVRIMDIIGIEDVVIECFIGGIPYISEHDLEQNEICCCDIKRYNYLKSTRKTVTDMTDFLMKNDGAIEGIDLMIRSENRDKIISAIENYLPKVYITSSEKSIIEISNIESGKHNGLRRICDILGINKSEVIAFGDNDNDIEMLQSAGLGVAVGNASDACKSAADVCVSTNDDDGVARYLTEFF